MAYNPHQIEGKWQKIWEKSGTYQTPDKIKGRKNFYCLDMFPYPSGEGLHVGHLHGYIGSDIVSRYFRMKGYNVLHPMGFDAFGLPAENAAIKRKIHPRIWTYKNIENIRKQLKSIGAVYDWQREIVTSEPEYYKWTQWMFLKFYKSGLVYRAIVPANFCPTCKTVLANEQVIEGKCERCDSQVLQKEIEQWLFKIKSFAEELLKDLEDLDWPETTKLMQKNWIGKSEGIAIEFRIKNLEFRIPVFTTRADTLFGCTYLVVAPEHPIIKNLKSQISNLKYVERYIEDSKKKTERERISEVKDKTGIEIKGIRAVNPANNREIPIFVADYVLVHYGTGAIMAVPAHDWRDFDFSKKYNLPVIEVIKQSNGPKNQQLNGAFEGKGVLVNSERFNGMKSETAKERIGEWLSKSGCAKKTTHYKLRDWIISRQRYWGVPIPLVFCEDCAVKIKNQKLEIKNNDFNKGELLNPGWISVPEKELPVFLPDIKDFTPTGEGKSPLAKSEKFVKTICPKCQGPAERETDTMDTFVCSSWYYFRYCDPKNEKKFASKEKIKAWLPVNVYIGGAEHSVGHLLYSRFFTKVLRELGYLEFKEPFLKLRHQGIILGPNSQKMSKSKGNVIAAESAIKKYGIDSVRLYEMFMGPFSETTSWDVKSIEGCSRFLQKVFKLFNKIEDLAVSNPGLEKLIHKTIKKVSEDIENFRFNTAISALMILANEMAKQPAISNKQFKILLFLLSPFAPHLTEELWSSFAKASEDKRPDIKNSIHNQLWPKYNPKIIKEKTITLIIQINGKVRDKIEIESDISGKEAQELALNRETIKKWIQNKKIKKVIFVPRKLINFVI